MTAYTDAVTIAAYLGVTLTPEQTTLAESLAHAASDFIDRYTGRSWQSVSPVAGELANVVPSSSSIWPRAYGIVYLAARPVASVSAVTLRPGSPHPSTMVLDAGDFELVDPANGVLTLNVAAAYGPYPETLAVVDYAYADTVPADITLAATMIAAGQLSAVLAVQRGSGVIAAHPELAGLESIAVGQNDVSVKLGGTVTGSAASATSKAGSSWAAPGSAVAAILDGYRRPVIA